MLVAAFREQGVPMELGAPEADGEDALRAGRLDLLVEPAGSVAEDPELPPLAVLRRGEARDGLLVRAEHLAEVAARLEERAAECDRLAAELARYEVERDAALREAGDAAAGARLVHRELAAIRGSASWRWTAPLRWLATRLGGARRDPAK